MADSKISDLAAVTDVLDTDAFVLARSGATKKITAASLLGSSLIEEITVGAGGAASIDFQSIAATWRHLEIYAELQAEDGSSQALKMNFNNDTGSNYYWQQLVSAGTGVSAAEGEATTSRISTLPPTGDAQPLALKIVIPYYKRTTFRKRALAESYTYRASDNRLEQFGMLWLNTAAITRVTLLAGSGDIKEGSIASLYGVR